MNKIQADSPDQVTILINGVQIRQFFNESILFSIDQLGAGFSFETPFYPESREYRDLFRPKQYQRCQLYIGQDLKISGRVEKISPRLTPKSNTVVVQVRSLPGVLVDVTFSKEDQKEFLKADLEEIANIVTKDHCETSFPEGAGAIFEQAGPQSPTTKKFTFLQNLTRQRSLLMGQTADGKLLFRKAKTSGKPVAELIEGQQGIMLSTADYDSTKRFSKYDVFGQERGQNANCAEIEDESIPVTRPKSLIANDTNQGNIEDSAKWALSADIGSSINIPLGYESWFRPDGELWAENELITIKAPSLMIYKPFTLLIKSVLFLGTGNKKVVSFGLTLPEVYTGEIPEKFPWAE